MPRIDLNSDLGESFGNYTFGDDAAVLASVSSANVACGFHGGDPHGIRTTCRKALELGVTIGAHPGYRDLPGFGRRFIDYDLDELTDEVIYQVGAVQAMARSVGAEVRYVKPHGGLYNTIAVNEEQAGAVARALSELAPELPLMVLSGSVIERVAREAGLRTVAEAFADRGYQADGTLVKRGTPGAIHTPEAAVAQAVRIATEGRITAVDGTDLEVAADSICLHGDNPAAVRLAGEIRAGLEAAGVEIRSFA
ncbi:LamB/YcsF family protein [Leucobacter ruminantium]|uniref:5-oxoprolinase subunit A n=1 Tax=Leucobacter ruminantium TaxID=1289170 RepID=A0A939LRY9_9MICO|nr:5-oxoprolinase subunit PxpA [Leucobacter ruminantium]MBO1803815.1 LamB/YcsF family protein [Leucobacter ruminantium]